MKVLTLTTQFANNYGALLQCYALSRYLNTLEGVECQVINYLPEGYKRSWSIIRKPRSIKEFAKMIYSLMKVGFVFDKKAKNSLMKLFINNYIKLTDYSYNRKQIVSNPPVADAFICGSDQIWNQIIFKDLTYYLDFVKDDGSSKRISYAASIADSWSNDFELFVKNSLNKFNSISLREKGNIPQVQSLVPKKKIQWVIDPVFLLNRSDWDLIVKEDVEDEPYIFCYFLNVSSFAVEVVKKLRRITGLKVVNLSLDALDKFHSDKLVRRAGPQDFIGYVKNAKYICTNSFHCSAFSVIYNKKFSFIPKSWANERILSLQEIFDIDIIMTREKYDSMTEQTFDVNYNKGRKCGDMFINKSKDFLKTALYA